MGVEKETPATKTTSRLLEERWQTWAPFLGKTILAGLTETDRREDGLDGKRSATDDTRYTKQ